MSDTAGGDRAESKRKVAVVVVHGVGDTEPGATVNYIVDALCNPTEPSTRAAAESEAQRQNVVYRFEEPSTRLVEADREIELAKLGQPGKVTSGKVEFPVYGRHLRMPSGTEASFLELHWSDLTQKDSGIFNSAVGFARFIFEIPHVIDGFLRDPPGGMSRLYRRLVLLATCFVRGPLAGYCAVMLAGGLIFLSYDQIPDREDVTKLFRHIAEWLTTLTVQLPPWLQFPDLTNEIRKLPDTRLNRILPFSLAASIVVSALIGLAYARRLVKRAAWPSGALCVSIVALFFLVDCLWLRPHRYVNYAGIAYIDYLSASMFAIGWIGAHYFVTRRERDVGFADLGLFTWFWAWFFVFDLSPLGEALRKAVGFKDEILVTVNDTSSSAVQFKSFDLYYEILSWLWAIWGILMLLVFLLAVLLYLFNGWRWSNGYRGIFAALGLAVVQSCVWLTVLPALAVLHMDDVLCRSNRYSEVDEPLGCQTKLRQNREVLGLLKQLKGADQLQQIKLEGTLKKTLEDVLQDRDREIHKPMLSAMKELSLSFVWHGAILVGLFSIGLLVALYRKARSTIRGNAPGHLALPRLIVTSWGLIWLGVLGFLNVLLTFTWIDRWKVTDAVMSSTGLGTPQAIAVPAEAVQMAILASTGMIILSQLPVFRTSFIGILDIMQDLIDHHYRIGTGFVGRFTRTPRDAPIRRERIAARLDVVMKELVGNKRFDDVVFLGHSQGTVIIYDFLRGPQASDGLGGKRPHIVTAGSPLGPLYHYYFNEYRSIDAPNAGLGVLPASWINFYRLDDPIAGPIAIGACGKTSSAAVAPLFPFENFNLGSGGHLRYWPNENVCRAILNVLDGRPGMEGLTSPTLDTAAPSPPAATGATAV